jgi:WD40 repeat protein
MMGKKGVKRCLNLVFAGKRHATHLLFRAMACTRVIQCEDAVINIDITPGEQLLVVGLRDGGKVQLLDAPSGERRPWLEDSMLLDDAIAYHKTLSPAGVSPLLLVAGFDDGTVRVWDCSSGVCVAELEGHSNSVACVAFSPDGRLLASGSDDDTVRLWRTDDWSAPPAVLVGHEDCVTGVSFSCDGRLLASCSNTVQLWHFLDSDTAAAAAAAPAAGPVLEFGKSVFCVAFSPVDSRLLACGGEEGYLVLARVGACDDTISVEREMQSHYRYVRRLAFSPCGQKLASTSGVETLLLWSVASGACLRVLRGHTDNATDMAFFPNGKQLASCSLDRTVRIWTLCAWSDKTHRLFGAPLKAAVFTLMCVRARLEQGQQQQQLDGPHALQLPPRLPMEVWLLVFGQLQLALEV